MRTSKGLIVLMQSAIFSVTLCVAASSSFAETMSKESCERLASLSLANTRITLAEFVPAGGFKGPGEVFSGRDMTAFYKGLPAFCRVVAEAHPSADSNIKIEVWMPASGWTGRLQGLGNGGFAGLLDYHQMGASMQQGAVATTTDAGHTGESTDATWALGHPEKIADFGHRGIHEMTRVAKAVSRSFYSKDALRSYFSGCSDGGREALMEAQKYPADYDGILAGAPANYWTALLSTSMFDSQALMLDPASYIPAAKIPVIASAVLKACDAKDGVSDGILNDPRRCQFDAATLLCRNGTEADACLTSPQVAALKKIYDGPRDAKGKVIFPGYLPGAEDGPGGWGVWIVGPAAGKSLMYAFGTGYFSDMVYDKPDWDYKSFQMEQGLKDAVARTATALDAVNPDLGPFKVRGGKLILYHGWNDPAIPARNTIDYYQSVVAKMGNPDSFARLYMVPGMQHCGGGPGADVFGQVMGTMPDDARHNINSALQAWVEKGTGPSEIVAAKYAPGSQTPAMTRPLCVYPQSAQYKGSGDTNDAANFICAVEKK
jgi:Tannase and feruloyl esterase